VTLLIYPSFYYRHFGREVVGSVLGSDVSAEDAEKIYLKTYDVYIKRIVSLHEINNSLVFCRSS
jgi:hypothetical protein